MTMNLAFIFGTFSALLLLNGCDAKCENPSNLPVKSGDKYLCGIGYQAVGHPDAFFACNGGGYYYADERHETAESGLYFPFGSIIVKAGCTFYGYKDINYQGEKHIHKGPLILPEVNGLVSPADPVYPRGYASFLCDCDMAYVNCVPEDKFEVVLYCDASSATVDTACKYSKTIGTSFSSSISESMSIDSTIEASLKADFFGLFEATLSTSLTTGYNWGKTSEEAKSEQVTVAVDAIAPAGQILTIEQAVGHCDGSSVKTEMYKISHSNSFGRIIRSNIVHASQLEAYLQS